MRPPITPGAAVTRPAAESAVTRLAAAGLAHDAERLAARDGEARAVHRADEGALGARVEVGPQVLDREERVHHRLRLPSRRLFRPSPSSWNPRMVGEDRERRRGRRPELALQEIVRAGLDHVAPGRRGLLHAEAEVGEARLDQDRLGHAERRLDHEQRAAVEPQDVLEYDRVRRQPERVRGLDEALLPEKRDLARDQVGGRRHAGDADHDHHVVDVGLERGDHEQDQHQPRERVEQVGEVGDDRVEPPALVAREDAENGAACDRNRDRQQPWEEVGLDAEDQPRLQVAAEEVGAERVPGRERRRVDQRDVHRPAGRGAASRAPREHRRRAPAPRRRGRSRRRRGRASRRAAAAAASRTRRRGRGSGRSGACSPYSFDARGLTAVKTMRCRRFPKRTKAAATSAMPMITG